MVYSVPKLREMARLLCVIAQIGPRRSCCITLPKSSTRRMNWVAARCPNAFITVSCLRQQAIRSDSYYACREHLLTLAQSRSLQATPIADFASARQQSSVAMALAGRCSQLAGSLVSALRPMQACRSLTTQTLPDLPYDYNALEPVISAEIMKLHHSKHHNTYITTLNQSYEKYADAEAKGDVAKMIELQQAIKFNGGGKIIIRQFLTRHQELTGS